MAKEGKKTSKKDAAVKPTSAEEVEDEDMEASTPAPPSKSQITSSFKPPKGFQELPVPSDKTFAKTTVDSKQTEIIVLRVPIDFPLDALNGLEIPLESTSASANTSKPLATVKVAKSGKASKKQKEDGEAKEKKVEYGVFSLAASTGILGAGGVGGEVGEMDEFLPLVPDAKTGGYRIASKKFTRHLSIAPLNSKIPTAADFISSANTLKAVEYVPRSHPEGLKEQYVPYGAVTEGVPLKESLSRYGLGESAGVKRKSEDVEASPAAAPKKAKKIKKEGK